MGLQIAIYDESRMSLGHIDFVNDTLDHVSLADMASYERTKQFSLCFPAIAEAMRITNPIADFDKREIQELVLSKFKRLSINEVYYAFKLERFGEYEEGTPSFNRFDSIYVAQILNKYVEWKREVRRKHNLDMVKKDKETPQLSQKEKDSIVAQGVLRIFGEYKALGDISTGDSYIYEVLYDDGFLPTDAETKKKVYEDAKEVLKFDIESKKPLSIEEKEHFKVIMNAIEKKRDPIVIAEAKRLTVRKFFRKVANDTDAEKKFTEHYNKKIID